MPLARITHHKDALTDTQKGQLAERLTAALLLGEVGADTPAGRAVTYILFQEVDPATSWYVSGKPDHSPPPRGRFVCEVFYPEGAAPQSSKTELHAAINLAITEY